MRRVDVKTAVRKNQQTIRLFVGSVAGRSVNPNWTFVAEDFAGEFVALHSSSRNFRLDDVPHLRLGRRQFDRRIESHFIRVELIRALGKLERVERVVPEVTCEAGDAAAISSAAAEGCPGKDRP